MAIYATFVAALAVICRSAVPQWPVIVLWHTGLVVALLWLPARGAPWERARVGESAWRSRTRVVFRFLRYTYPALLLTPFFEEVALTVNAVFPNAPHWFEGWLFAADRALFGGIPAVMLSQRGGPIIDEIMHAFYFAYFPLIIGGIVLAWTGGPGRRERPGAGFHTAFTGMMLGFFLSYVWYPFLPARGPWEHPEVMSGLRPFGGWVFTRIIQSDHRRRSRIRRMLSERSRVRRMGADLRALSDPPHDGTLVRAGRRRSQHRVRVYALPPRRRCARRVHGWSDRRSDWLSPHAARTQRLTCLKAPAQDWREFRAGSSDRRAW